jgi:hypothetical protein
MLPLADPAFMITFMEIGIGAINRSIVRRLGATGGPAALGPA